MDSSTVNSPKKLFRSRKNRVLAGVCGGLGAYFAIDPLVVRVIFVALALANGAGILIYIVLALLVPNETSEGQTVEPTNPQTQHFIENRRNIIAIIIIAVGVIALLNATLPIHWFRWEIFWPIVIIAIGIGLIIKRRN